MGEYCHGKGKGKIVSFDAMKAYRKSRIIAILLTSALDRSVQYHDPAALHPCKNPGKQLNRRPGAPQSR